MQSLISKKYIQGFNRNKLNYKIEEDGSIASLILLNKIQTLEKKTKYFLENSENHTIYHSNDSLKHCLSFCPRDFEKIITITKNIILGCILLVDISGFTKLSSQLCTEGINGIDLLRQITNNSFAQFIECVYYYNGDGKVFLSFFFYLSI